MSHLFICPCCGGDGKETCDNPDHGFIYAMGGELGRLGCPVCGHDPDHKVRGGRPCFACKGIGKLTIEQFDSICDEYGYDKEAIAAPQTT